MECNRKTADVDKTQLTFPCADVIMFGFHPLFVILSGVLCLESTVILHYLASIFCHFLSARLSCEHKPTVPDSSQILITNATVLVK
jgi:hypothetical protein